jgi:hypothetical protein
MEVGIGIGISTEKREDCSDSSQDSRSSQEGGENRERHLEKTRQKPLEC